jgi:triphosphoribosyl-dephospho-CoA synthase
MSEALPNEGRLSIGQAVTLACVLEATAHKPGNVHRGADFADMTYLDMVSSAVAIGPVLENSANLGVGAAIYRSVQATQRLVGKNTNLGTVLLLTPLAIAANHDRQNLRPTVATILQSLTPADAYQTYAAIRLANPAGLGQAEAADVHADPPDDLLQAMQLARERDLIAKQFVTGFADVFDLVLPQMTAAIAEGMDLLDAIVLAHVQTMARYPDSLIARKCGAPVAQQASDRAARVVEARVSSNDEYLRALNELDFWLRSDGHQRNPGTTADLLAAAIFAGLIQGTIQHRPQA